MIILDIKWKNLINNKYKNFGISRADMYQMYAYAKKIMHHKYGLSI